MKSKHEDFKWNGILIFGKRFGRYNIAITYLVINITISLLVTISRLLSPGLAAEYLRNILAVAFLSCTLFAFKAVTCTNVLLIASPKVCAFFLRSMKPKLLLIENSNTCLKFKKATGEEKGYIYIFDIHRNIIWFDYLSSSSKDNSKTSFIK